jgi:TPP-dependent trihydroxycyclohexane-1,2-dione (THcHDO) dehydratase
LLTEQVSEQRFDDFKEQMFRMFADLKGALDSLNGKIDAYNNMYQNQSNDIAVLKTKTEELEKLKPKVECQGTELARIDEANKSRQRFTLLIFSTITIIIAILSNWDKIFK